MNRRTYLLKTLDMLCHCMCVELLQMHTNSGNTVAGYLNQQVLLAILLVVDFSKSASAA